MQDYKKLENVFRDKYKLDLKNFTNGNKDYFTIKIQEDLSIEFVKDNNKFIIRGINLGQMNIVENDIHTLHAIIQNINKEDPLHGSILCLTDMDNYFYLELLDSTPLIDSESTKEGIFDLMSYLIEIGKEILGKVYPYLYIY